MTQSSTARWQWLAVAVGVGTLIWLLSPILTPFVVAAGLGWLGDPLVDRLERAGRARSTAVVLVFATIIGLLSIALLFLLPLLWAQVQHLFEWLPHLSAWITEDVVPWVKQRFHFDLSPYVDPDQLVALLQSHWAQAGGLAAGLLGSGLAVFEVLVSIALVPVLSFYFLRDWDIFVERVRELVPRPWLPEVTRLAIQTNQVLAGFVRGQLSVMIAQGALYAIGLWLVGLDLGLLIGFIAGLVSFVPYLGAFIGVGLGVIATLVQHGDSLHLLLVLLVFTVGHLVESWWLTPWLVGDRIGMHPVAVIFSIMAGGQLFGFLGVLLALPVAAVVMVGLRYGHEHYTRSTLYGAPLPEPVEESALAESLPEDFAHDPGRPEA